MCWSYVTPGHAKKKKKEDKIDDSTDSLLKLCKHGNICKRPAVVHVIMYKKSKCEFVG